MQQTKINLFLNLYTVLSTCNEVTFPANIYFLLRYFALNHVVTEVEMCQRLLS